MSKKISLLMSIALCGSCMTAIAQPCASYTYTLTNGTTADASQVMGNFNTVRNCVNSLQTGGTFVTPNIGAATGTSLSLSGNLAVTGKTGLGTASSSTTALNLSAATTGASSLRIPAGTAPTSPVDGDVWTTTSGAFVRVNGATQSLGGGISSKTAVALTGTFIDFTGLPATAKRITIIFSGMSTSGTSVPLIQLGDSGGVETTGYLGGATTVYAPSNVAASNYTTGFGLEGVASIASNIFHGTLVLTLLDTSNTWVASGTNTASSSAFSTTVNGTKQTSATLDRVRITTVGGSDSFDAGTVNIQYE